MYIFEKIMPLELAMVVIQFSFQIALLIVGIKDFTIDLTKLSRHEMLLLLFRAYGSRCDRMDGKRKN